MKKPAVQRALKSEHVTMTRDTSHLKLVERKLTSDEKPIAASQQLYRAQRSADDMEDMWDNLPV